MFRRSSIAIGILAIFAVGCQSKEEAAIARVNASSQEAAFFRIVDLTGGSYTSLLGPAPVPAAPIENGSISFLRTRSKPQKLEIKGDSNTFSEEVTFAAKSGHTAFLTPSGSGFEVSIIEGSGAKPEGKSSRLTIINLTGSSVSATEPASATAEPKKAASAIDLNPGSVTVKVAGLESKFDALEGVGYTAVVFEKDGKPQLAILTDHPAMNIQLGGASAAG